MRIASVRVQRAEKPRPHVRLQLTDEDGRVGEGDAAPLAPFSREDAAMVAEVLEALRLDPLDEALPAVESISLVLKRFDERLDAAPSARLCVETGLLDLLAQRRGVSVARLLGGEGGAVGLNALLIAQPVETLADRAAALAEAGYGAIKIKLRAPGEEGFARELWALGEVRARLPLPFEIRLDPNAAWTLDEARRRLDALAAIAPRYVEQPAAAGELHRLGVCAVPWAADESLVDPVEAERLLDARGCAAFVIKPAVLGGILRARALAVRAAERGLDVVITHLFDGPCALAVACELAVSLPRPPLACGLAPHGDLAAFGEVIIPQLAAPATARSSGGPGLRVRWGSGGDHA